MAKGLPLPRAPYRAAGGKAPGRQSPLPKTPRAIKKRAPKTPKCS